MLAASAATPGERASPRLAGTSATLAIIGSAICSPPTRPSTGRASLEIDDGSSAGDGLRCWDGLTLRRRAPRPTGSG
jgi:hypothetical protein